MAATCTVLPMEEFLAIPSRPGKQELLAGKLIDLPPVKVRYKRVQHRMYDRLQAALESIGSNYEVHMLMGYELGPLHLLQPDVSIPHPDQPVGDYYQGSPLVAIEIVGESNMADEIDGKIEDYLAYGGKEVWMVYADRGHMWIYRQGGIAERHSGSFPVALLNNQVLDLDQMLDG
jgi:Uma2 family endonuclease